MSRTEKRDQADFWPVEKAYPKIVAQGGDAERYGTLKFRVVEIIFVAYDKAEKREAKMLVIASSDFVHTSKSLFWPDAIRFQPGH